MRILLVEHTATIGGGERSMLDLVRLLVREHEVGIACPRGDLAEAADAIGARIFEIPYGQLTFRLQPVNTPRMLGRCAAAGRVLRRHVRDWEPDLVHANSVRGALIAGLARQRGVPLVVHCRDVLPPGPLGVVVRRLTVAIATRLVAVSRCVAEDVAGPEWIQRRVRVVDNPVDHRRFDPSRVTAPLSCGTLPPGMGPVLAVVGQITEWKRQDLAIRAVAALRDVGPPAHLLIVGIPMFVGAATRLDNRGYEQSLYALVRTFRLDDVVHFLGHREDVEALLSVTDLLLVPSRLEPFGRTVVEALAMGVPVLAVNAGGPREVMRDGIDGLTLSPAAGADEWACAAKQVLAADEPSLRGERRRYAVDRFSAERHLARMLDVYAESLGERNLTTSTGRMVSDAAHDATERHR